MGKRWPITIRWEAVNLESISFAGELFAMLAEPGTLAVLCAVICAAQALKISLPGFSCFLGMGAWPIDLG